MPPLSWLLLALLAAVALAAAFFMYRRREPPGPGRMVLAGLRGAVLVLLLLLLFDPEVPGAAGHGAGRTVVLVDASLSMGAPTEGGGGSAGTPWSAALDSVRARGAGRVLLFGAGVRAVAADSLAATSPGEPASRLAPAIRAAAESGASDAVVLTDGRLEDAAEAARVAADAGFRVRVRLVGGGSLADRAVAEVGAPEWAEAGKPMHVRIAVAATDAAGGDSVPVVLRRDGSVLARGTVRAPAPGRLATIDLEIRPDAPDGGGLVRFEAAVDQGDSVPDDDARAFYVFVSDAPSRVAVVSLQPGQEARFLVPVLGDALGLPVAGFIHVAGERWVRTGGAMDAGAAASASDVRSAAQDADLLVLLGLGSDAPTWAVQAAEGARHLLVLPTGDSPPDVVPLRLPPPTTGEWYVTREPPATPLSGYLSGLAADSLPPLLDLRVVEPPSGGWAPLEARRMRSGAAAPALVLGSVAGRRWAVALADGWWRWAFRPGAPRDAYRALWSAVAGWILQGRSGAGVAAVRPAAWAVQRDGPLAWVAGGIGPDSIRVAVTDSAGSTVLETTAPADGDTARTVRPAPGRYSYRAAAFLGDSMVAQGEGPLEVERWSNDWIRPRQEAEIAAAERTPGLGSRGQASMRTSPWPWLLAVLLLCGEWLLRRRWGLR